MTVIPFPTARAKARPQSLAEAEVVPIRPDVVLINRVSLDAACRELAELRGVEVKSVNIEIIRRGYPRRQDCMQQHLERIYFYIREQINALRSQKDTG